MTMRESSQPSVPLLFHNGISRESAIRCFAASRVKSLGFTEQFARAA
jgi:hypothetical protein